MNKERANMPTYFYTSVLVPIKSVSFRGADLQSKVNVTETYNTKPQIRFQIFANETPQINKASS